jgi:superfamily II DNA/RNA helicase
LNAHPDKDSAITLVFCNTMASCRSVSHYLEECGFRIGSYHGGMPPKLRDQHWSAFVKGEVRLLVTTDLYRSVSI